MSDEPGLCPKCGTPLADDAPAGMCPRCLVLAGFDSGAGVEHDGAFPSRSGAGNAFEPPAPEEIAPWFPQLEIVELIGHGGMGAVYKARQPKLDRIVALKIIRPESAQAPTFAERFTREARTLARLNHPHVVSLHDFGEVADADSPGAEPLYYFIMEYVDGASLRELLDAGPVDPEQGLRIVSQICDALQFAHDEGVVHRDIKPENILIDQRGRVRIADFGLARLLVSTTEDFTLTATHQIMGTPLYMAPEQMTGSHAVDHRADLYSLGVVLYEMLTGELSMGQFDPPSPRAGVDVRFDDVVRQSLAREPDRRFQQASEVRESVEEICGQGARRKTPQPQRPQAFSSIANREVMNVFRFMASDAEQSTHHRPEMPAMLLIAMCAAGCLMVLLPWFHIEIEQQTHIFGMTVQLQDAVTLSVAGSDEPMGICVSILFGVAGLLIIMVPADKRTAIWLPGFLIVLAGVALGMTIVFRVMIDTYAIPYVADIVDPIIEDHNEKRRALDRTRYAKLEDAVHKIEYRQGFYGSVGLSVAVLLLSAVGVRNALAHRAPRQNRLHAETPPPRPSPAPKIEDSDLDLIAVRAELDAPSLSVLVVGVLMTLINLVLAIFFWLDGGPGGEEYAAMLLPGMLIGVLMTIAGTQMRSMKSRGWAIIGCIAGVLPANPGWLLAAAASTWALVVMDRPNVKQAFIEFSRLRQSPGRT